MIVEAVAHVSFSFGTCTRISVDRFVCRIMFVIVAIVFFSTCDANVGENG